MTKKDICVGIPFYKSSLNKDDKVSLEQCLDVLSEYDLYLFAPESLDLGLILSEYNLSISQVIRFNDKFFEGPESYSELLLSPTFYEKFLPHKYLLIYQLDAFVFKDELLMWCQKGYDYIGAPWYGAYFPNSLEFRKGLPIWRSNLRIRKLLKEPDRTVGNGGFSLRKIKSFTRNLRMFKRHLKNWHCRDYEDTFFSIALPNLNPLFKIPNEKEAKYFSLELKAREKIKEIDCLPFGAHAWKKHDEKLYEDYILNKKTYNT